MDVGEELELIGIEPEIWSSWLVRQDHLESKFENGQISLYVKNEDGQMRRVQRVFVQLDEENGDAACQIRKGRNQT